MATESNIPQTDVSIDDQNRQQENIGFFLGWICAVSGLIGVISMIVFFVKKKNKNAIQAFFLPI